MLHPLRTRWHLVSISAAQKSKASYTSRMDTSCAMYLAVSPRCIFTTPAAALKHAQHIDVASPSRSEARSCTLLVLMLDCT